jgi:hypothetical protein
MTKGSDFATPLSRKTSVAQVLPQRVGAHDRGWIIDSKDFRTQAAAWRRGAVQNVTARFGHILALVLPLW